ncbi:hypothetical protein MMC20_007566 [Loxospora ochrophaea]|nr:hypothetical protein [Loxospora ochrophaea]
MDIIWSCVSTLFVCIWVMLHLNVPASTDGYWTVFLRRSRWVALSIFAPELVMLFASGQWASAKRSVRDMIKLGHTDWSLIHAFYADSSGFVLQAPDMGPFPITAQQIHYLIQKGYMAKPTITKAEIWDKSKADHFAKIIGALQAGWFVTQTAARGVQGLPVTLLELSTTSLITCTAATFFFWFYKPLNVSIPTVLPIKSTIAQILLDAGPAAKDPFQNTPLDFIEPTAYTSSQFPLKGLWGVQERPLPRLPNDRDSQLHNLQTVLMVTLPTAAFGTFHLIAWNFIFPTRTEQLLWRWTSISMGVVLGSGCAIEAASIIKSNYTATGLTNLREYKLKWPTNLLFFIPGLFYFLARMLVITEVLISLRALPAGCFQAINWIELVPHI